MNNQEMHAGKIIDNGTTEETAEAVELQTEIEEIPPQKPVITVRVFSDKQTAEIRLSRETPETLNPTREDIEEALAKEGIVYGIDNKLITHLCERPTFGVDMEIAKGKPAKTGKNGYLTYLVETKKDLRPKLREDGTVDYRDLGFIQNVVAGQPLCEVHYAEKGEDGSDILGTVLEGIYGKDPIIPAGKNTKLDEEINAVVSNVNGDVVVDSRGIINVHDVLKIPKNVDNSTGDISFAGDVFINGDVASGFKVDSQGSIFIKGTVEGAKLSAKGDITVNEGINGMNSAKLVAGGSIKCKYIQNANLTTDGDIFADTIMHCTIECNSCVELSGKRGVLVGGKTLIAKTLTANTIGTDSHVATHVTMAGGGLSHNKKLQDLKKQISALDTELTSTIQTLVWCKDLQEKGKLKPFQLNALKHGLTRHAEIPKEREELLNQLEAVQKVIDSVSPEETYIKCSGRVHSGVRIMFGTQTMHVKASFVNSRIFLIDGEITILPQ